MLARSATEACCPVMNPMGMRWSPMSESDFFVFATKSLYALDALAVSALPFSESRYALKAVSAAEGTPAGGGVVVSVVVPPILAPVVRSNWALSGLTRLPLASRMSFWAEAVGGGVALVA